MSEYNTDLNRELKELEKDKIINENELENERNRMSFLLKGDMGKDIDDVLNGKVKIKLSLCERIKYKINYYLDKIFNII